MKVIVPHRKTQAEARAVVDKSSGDLMNFSGPVEIADRNRSWRGPVMDFSFTARYGFISVPISGTATVDDKNVTIECELPPLVQKFLGEDKVRKGIEKKITPLLV